MQDRERDKTQFPIGGSQLVFKENRMGWIRKYPVLDIFSGPRPQPQSAALPFSDDRD